MMNERLRKTVGLLSSVVLVCCWNTVEAGGFAIDWYTIDGGGGMTSTGGGYELAGTIGQPDAGSFDVPMTGGGFEVTGGFWGVAAGGSTSAATIVSAASVLDHGGTELGLDLLAGSNVEPRNPGVVKLEIGLTDAVSSVSAAVSCVNNTYGDSITTTVVGSTVTVEFGSALPDEDCCDITLSGDADDVLQVRTVAGDIDRNGSVTTGDASIIKPRFNGNPAVEGAEFDFNVDGSISTSDFSQVKPLFNNAAPTCP